METADVIVIGAGAIGASTALHLSRLGFRVAVLEKEGRPAVHQSGRNSGVIHAGYNLTPGTLKARFCAEGNRLLRAYCRDHSIPMLEGGILVVAGNPDRVPILHELLRRAQANGVTASVVEQADIHRLEPNVAGCAALHAPEGASFDAVAYVASLLRDACNLGARVQYDSRVTAIVDHDEGGSSPVVRMPAGDLHAALIVNCAGLQADRLAGSLARDVRVIPFRGAYAELVPQARHLINSHVYPVPDLAFPFLGVHLSRRVDGRVTIGPGALLAAGRETYGGWQLNALDLFDTFTWPGFYGLLRQPRFRTLVRQELAKGLSLRPLWAEARTLVPALRPADVIRSFAGNRAQMVSRHGELIDDLLVRETERTVHVLNAVSPGLTCSLPFGAYLADRCRQKLGG